MYPATFNEMKQAGLTRLRLETEGECLLYPILKKILIPYVKEACMMYKTRELVTRAFFPFHMNLYASLVE